MDWSVIVAAILMIVVAIGWIAHRSEKKEKALFAELFAEKTSHFSKLLATGEMPSIDPREIGYRPISDEIIYAVRIGIKDNRNGTEGRLLVTNKALVFETAQRSERFTLSSMAGADIAIDGFSLRKRNGPVRPFWTGSNPHFLALVNVLLGRPE